MVIILQHIRVSNHIANLKCTYVCFNNISIKLGGKKAKNQILKEMMRVSSFLKLTVLMLSESALSYTVESSESSMQHSMPWESQCRLHPRKFSVLGSEQGECEASVEAVVVKSLIYQIPRIISVVIYWAFLLHLVVVR